jgi:hypothetical protein
MAPARLVPLQVLVMIPLPCTGASQRIHVLASLARWFGMSPVIEAPKKLQALHRIYALASWAGDTYLVAQEASA